MSIIEVTSRSRTDAFPKDAVANLLRDELTNAAMARAVMQGGSSGGASQEVDSLSVVTILCSVDDIVGFEVPQKVVRAGGYASIEEAVNHVVPRIEGLWSKRKGQRR